MRIDPRFETATGPEIFTGNELMVKGALETDGGVHLMTGYPGSPIAPFFDTLGALSPLLKPKGVVAQMSNNEALGAAMINGAQMAGCRAICAMKSVGMHVASDALALGVLSGTREKSGGLIICGDDPWSESTQVPADSRFINEHLRLPTIEPSCPQEIKDWVGLAFKLGEAGQIYIGYIITTSLADGGGTVHCYPNHFPTLNEHQRAHLSYLKDIEPNLEQSLLLPPRTWRREMALDTRLDAVKQAASKLGVNRILHRPQKDERVPMGFIAAGAAYAYLAHALHELGLSGRIPILKLGLTWPVDETIVAEFAAQCEQVIVIEERRAFVERQVQQINNTLQQTDRPHTQVYGKRFPRGLTGIPDTRGLNPSVLIERLVPLMREHPTLPIELTNGRLTQELARIEKTSRYEVNLPTRTPTFCPGCPHRDSSSVLLELRQDLLDPEYMLANHKRDAVDLVCHGDTGCYTMLMFEPTKPLMHNYSGMGLGGGTGAGVDPFIDNKQLVFMGDGTFFHSGMAAIAQSIHNGQDITYIILDNKTTAMTGHQVNAGDNIDLRGDAAFAINIEKMVKSMMPRELKSGVRVVRINPADRKRYRGLLEETILADGVKVVIADKECGITYQRRVRRQERKHLRELGYLPKKTFMNVATDVCEHCLECTNQTGCPGLTVVDTDYGDKIQTDLSWCVDDGACQKIHACPSFEEVTVHRKTTPRKSDEYVDLSSLPAPPTPVHGDQSIWRAYLAGVGGMGIGVAGSVLVTAGHEMGYHVQFFDRKGLAIRNGGVFSQIVFTRTKPAGDTMHALSPMTNGKSKDPTPDALRFTTPAIPYGKADLLVGVDLLEACRAIDPRGAARVVGENTAAVVNTAKTPTVMSLMGREDFEISDLEAALKRYARQDQYFGFNVGDLCERMLDTKLYANIMMLGIAFQKGYIPVSEKAIENAIRKIVSYEVDRNIRAFNIGRKIAVRPDLFVVEMQHEYESSRRTFRRKLNTLKARNGKGWVGSRREDGLTRQFKYIMIQTFRATRGHRVDDALIRDVVIRAYDCLIWGGIEYAREYCRLLVQTFQRDDPDKDFRITRAVVWNLAKVMLIKDEVYVAALLTRPEKYKQDRRRFGVNPAHGDRITYRHYNRPEFAIFGRRIRFEIKTRDWQLRLMAKCRWLRKVLKGWHQREQDFRDWYIDLVEKLNYQGERDYERWLAILSTPADVTGYREVRYPKMEQARRRAEQLRTMDPELFEPAEMGYEFRTRRRNRGVELPVLSGS